MTRSNGRRSVLYCAAAACAAYLNPPIAAAQSSEITSIEEIVVTARRRDEPLIEVPVSVSAFTPDAITALGITRIDDIARFTPGFSANSATGRQPSSDRPAMRGLTTIRNGIANSSVAATFIDGIYMGGSIQSTELYNLERVEIIRGPQSAQFGRGTFAGAINYVTRRPGSGPEGDVSVTVGEHDTVELTGWFSRPLVDDRLAVSLAAGRRQYGGEHVNLRDNSLVGSEKSDDITVRLYWTPSDNFDVSLKLGTQRTDDAHFPIYLQPRTLNNCCERSAEAPRAREYYVGVAPSAGPVNLFTDLLDAVGESGASLRRRLATVELRWAVPSGGSFSSLTGLIDDDVERGFDSSYAAYDPLPFLPGSFTQLDELAQRDFSQELRYSAVTRSGLFWTVGAHFYDGSFDEVSDLRVFTDDTGTVRSAPNFGNLSRDRIENRALFAGAEWPIGEHWIAGAELRFASDEITVVNVTNDELRSEQARFSETYRSMTPRLTLSYLATPTRSYYVNVAKGTNPGDFNTDVPALADGSLDESFRAVDEERLWSYEIGTKGSWWRGRVTGSFAAYWSDVDDQQLTQIVELASGTTASILRNVGRTEIRGIEAEVAAEVSARVSLHTTYSYTHARIASQISVEEADLRGSDGSVEQTRRLGDVSGKRVPRVPEHMASVAVRYEHPTATGGRWYVGGDVTYESSKFAQEHNLIETGDSTLVGLVAGFAAGRWDASLRIANALDDDTPGDIIRYLDRRFGQLARFPHAGPDRVSSSPRGFAIALPRGRQVRTTFRYRF